MEEVSYEHRIYELVDGKSLSWNIAIKKQKLCSKGLWAHFSHLK